MFDCQHCIPQSKAHGYAFFIQEFDFPHFQLYQYASNPCGLAGALMQFVKF